MFDKRQMENEMIKYSQNNNMRMFIFQFKSWIDPLMIARFKIQICYVMLAIIFKTRHTLINENLENFPFNLSILFFVVMNGK